MSSLKKFWPQWDSNPVGVLHFVNTLQSASVYVGQTSKRYKRDSGQNTLNDVGKTWLNFN